MKKLGFLLLAIPVFLAGCTSKCIQDSGYNISEVRPLKSYDKIDVSGTMKLVLVQDSTYDIRVQADSNIIRKISSKVSGGKLTLKLENGKYCGTDSIIVYAGVGELRELSSDGMIRVTTEGPIYVQDLKLDMKGSPDYDLQLNASKLNTKMEGNGKLTLKGQAGSHILKTNGTVKVDAFDFITGIYDINIDGTGKANINVLNDLKVKTSGSSEIYYKGNPKNVNEKKSGAAKLEKVN